MLNKDLNFEIEKILLTLTSLLGKVEAIEKKIQPQDEWLDRHEAARFLKVSLRTIDSYRDQGLVPFTKIRGRVYVKKNELVKLLNEMCYGGNERKK